MNALVLHWIHFENDHLKYSRCCSPLALPVFWILVNLFQQIESSERIQKLSHLCVERNMVKEGLSKHWCKPYSNRWQSNEAKLSTLWYSGT